MGEKRHSSPKQGNSLRRMRRMSTRDGPVQVSKPTEGEEDVRIGGLAGSEPASGGQACWELASLTQVIRATF